MSNKEIIRLKILHVKTFTHYMVRENDTNDAKRFNKLEDLMQKTYSLSDDWSSRDQLDIGLCVSAYLNPYTNRPKAPKLWVRALVRNIFMSVGTYLYYVYLVDYGVDVCVKRTFIRELKAHFSPTAFVSYQAMDFHLFGVEDQNQEDCDLKTLKPLNDIFKLNNNEVSVIINNSITDKKSLLGSIELSDGQDLAQYLLDKRLVKIDNKSINYSNHEMIDVSVRKPKSTPFSKINLKKSSDVLRSVDNSQEFCCNLSTTSENQLNESNCSIDSISSVDLNIDNLSDSMSNASIIVNDSDNDSLKDYSLIEEMNGANQAKDGHKEVKIRRLKLLKELKALNRLENESKVDNAVVCERHLEIVSHPIEKEENEEIEWPVVESDRPAVTLKPAGVQPPSHVIQKIITLRQNRFFEF